MALHRFGTISDIPVTEVTLALASGVTASILDFGAIVRDLQIPDPDGGRRRVVLGYRGLAGYLADRAYLGAIVGRYANRIADGRFELGGRVHQLSRNEHNRTHLHGGMCGFNKRHWTIIGHDDASVTMMLTSPAGEEGYPGKVEVTCTYRLAPPATLSIEMQATADASTIVNLVHHSYFNLHYGHSIRDHLLQVNARNYTPVTQDLIPTGDIVPVLDTRYDFRVPRPLESASTGSDFLYDINFAIDRSSVDCRGPRQSRPPAAGSGWRFIRLSLDYNCMTAAISVPPRKVSMAGFISGMPVFALSRENFLMRLTTQTFLQRSSIPVLPIASAQSTASVGGR